MNTLAAVNVALPIYLHKLNNCVWVRTSEHGHTIMSSIYIVYLAVEMSFSENSWGVLLIDYSVRS